jgi:type IV pilus assembly protein PilO
MALSMDSIVKLSTTKKIIILVVCLGVISGAYFYSFFVPQQRELSKLDNDLDKLAKELNESKMIVRDLQRFKEQVEKLNQELLQALTQLPNEKEIPEILRNISTLGRESNLEFILFRPKPEEPQQFYAKVPIELTLVGSYHNIGLFFDKVSKLPRIINVVDFNMGRAKDPKGAKEGSDEVLVRTSCLLNTYRFVETKTEGKKSEGMKSEKREPTEEDGVSKAQKK